MSRLASVQGGDEREGKVGGTLPTGVEVRPYLRPPLFFGVLDELLPPLGRHVPGEAERLKPLEPALGLYAPHVALPLFAPDRVAGKEHAAGAEERVEVGVRPPVHGRPRGLHGLVEADLVLRLDRPTHVVPGQPRDQQREQEHRVSRRRFAQVAKEPAQPGPENAHPRPEPAYERPPPTSNTQDTATEAPATDNVVLTALRTFPFDSRCPDKAMLPGVQTTRKKHACFAGLSARRLRRLVGTLRLAPSLVGTLRPRLAVSTASGLARHLVGMPRAFRLSALQRGSFLG